MKKGRIICFEGIDGAGKRTQAALLMKRLHASGVKSKVYSYPDYSSKYGKLIREYLDGKAKLGRTEDFLLFLIDIMKDSEELKEDIKGGTVVIMDRYFYTALAYICPSGLDYSRAKKFVGLFNFIGPSVVLYLDIPTQLTPSRKMKKGEKPDKFERDQRFLKEVKKVYSKMLGEKYGCDKWIAIDASRQMDQVHKDILGAIGKEAL